MSDPTPALPSPRTRNEYLAYFPYAQYILANTQQRNQRHAELDDALEDAERRFQKTIRRIELQKLLLAVLNVDTVAVDESGSVPTYQRAGLRFWSNRSCLYVQVFRLANGPDDFRGRPIYGPQDFDEFLSDVEGDQAEAAAADEPR